MGSARPVSPDSPPSAWATSDCPTSGSRPTRRAGSTRHLPVRAVEADNTLRSGTHELRPVGGRGAAPGARRGLQPRRLDRRPTPRPSTTTTSARWPAPRPAADRGLFVAGTPASGVLARGTRGAARPRSAAARRLEQPGDPACAKVTAWSPADAQEIVDALPDGVVVADSRGRVELISAPAVRMLGRRGQPDRPAAGVRAGGDRPRRQRLGRRPTGPTRAWPRGPRSPSRPGCCPTAPRCSSPRSCTGTRWSSRSGRWRSPCAPAGAGPGSTGSAPTWWRPSPTSSDRR